MLTTLPQYSHKKRAPNGGSFVIYLRSITGTGFSLIGQVHVVGGRSIAIDEVANFNQDSSLAVGIDDGQITGVSSGDGCLRSLQQKCWS